MPFGNRVVEGFHSPTDGHQSPESSYHPQSMQKISAPTSAAAVINGSSLSVGVTIDRVHVIVEDDTRFGVILMLISHRTTVRDQ